MNILFVFAHPDDEAFGPAGTIRKLSDDGHRVWVLSLCKGNRPGADVEHSRKEAFMAVCKILGATPIICDSDDVHLDFHTAVADIVSNMSSIQPDVVYTHNISDLHRDHRTTAEAVMVACRPTEGNPVKTLYFCEIPASTDWTFGQIEPAFVPTTFVDIGKYMMVKQQVMQWYSTELHADARSAYSMEIMSQNRGRTVGIKYAEAFKLVFDICKQS
jgi:LmbE family N-acetylglucosaminyl deacetylase